MGSSELPKFIYQFYRLLEWLGSKGHSVPALPLDHTPLGYNAWFAGFTEADGGFMVRLTEPGGHRAETKRGHMLYVYHRTAADPP
jgi:hypothetical protein